VDAATELAQQYGAAVAGSFEELLERCDAIAFAVPPDVQAALAPRAAAAGKHLLLEKPLAFSLADAERLTDAVDEAGVSTLLFLTNRFTAEGREFVRRAADALPQAAQARSLGGGSLPGSFFATPWRIARGALLDLGPHVLDLLVTALGPVAEISATGDPTRVVALTTRHDSGLLGQALLSITTAHAEGALVCHVHSDSGPVVFDSRTVTDQAQARSTIAREFAASVRTGVPHELDVHRGLMLQRLLEQAEATLASSR
jgi:predicted dehydrogenase